MKGLMLIARREIGAYANGYSGWLIVSLLLMANGLMFNAFAMGKSAKPSSEVLEDFFYYSFGIVCVAAVMLTMRLIAEERQTGTLVLIDSSPLADWQVVGGKWLSAMIFIGGMTAISLYMPGLIFINGKVSLGHIAAGTTGILLVGSAVAAIGTFASTLSRSQVVAAIIGGVIVFVLLLAWLLGRITDAPLDEMWSYVSLYDRHFQPFQRGRINTEDVVFYVSITFVFLLMSTRIMSVRRWR